MKPGGNYIVTGATGAIGRAIVNGLIERGAERILLACRDSAKAQSLIDNLPHPATELEVLPLDLTSFTSVRNCALDIARRGIHIRALFNNAGTLAHSLTITPDGYETSTQTNFLATALLTRLLLPAIEDGGAIIFTTSLTRFVYRLRADWEDRSVTDFGRFSNYGRSKLMLTHFALDLARRLAPRAITVNCSDPGIVDTDIITMDNSLIDTLSQWLFRPFVATPSQGAAPALRAAESSETGWIFSTIHDCPIPHTYSSHPLHSIATQAIDHLPRPYL